jgi:hypothetical protein
MIFHISIDAHDPPRVAAALARLWQAEALPFPPIGEGSLIVLADDERNSAIEVYPRGIELHPAPGDADAQGLVNAGATGHSATHVAIATRLTEVEVMALAAEHGWEAKYRKRGGAFGVIEVWIENRFMVEVLTAEMQAEYLATMTPAGWRATLAAGAPAQAA